MGKKFRMLRAAAKTVSAGLCDIFDGQLFNGIAEPNALAFCHTTET